MGLGNATHRSSPSSCGLLKTLLTCTTTTQQLGADRKNTRVRSVGLNGVNGLDGSAVDYLDSDFTSEFGVPRSPHLPHPALAERGQDLVMAKLRAGLHWMNETTGGI